MPSTLFAARLSADGIQLSENSEPIAYLPPLVQQGVDTDFSTYRLGFDAAWELDFWGRFRRIVEAADSSLAARVAAYAGGDEVNPLVEEYESWLNENYPQIMTRVRKYTVGPGDTWPTKLCCQNAALVLEFDQSTVGRFQSKRNKKKSRSRTPLHPAFSINDEIRIYDRCGRVREM